VSIGCFSDQFFYFRFLSWGKELPQEKYSGFASGFGVRFTNTDISNDRTTQNQSSD
jgi:hypothetical protein